MNKKADSVQNVSLPIVTMLVENFGSDELEDAKVQLDNLIHMNIIYDEEKEQVLEGLERKKKETVEEVKDTMEEVKDDVAQDVQDYVEDEQDMVSVTAAHNKQAGTELWETPEGKWWLLSTVTMTPVGPVFDTRDTAIEYAVQNKRWTVSVGQELVKQQDFRDGLGTPADFIIKEGGVLPEFMKTNKFILDIPKEDLTSASSIQIWVSAMTSSLVTLMRTLDQENQAQLDEYKALHDAVVYLKSLYKDVVKSTSKAVQGTVIQSKIVKRDDGYYVISESAGKTLGGPYTNREEAETRMRQVEYFKHKGVKTDKNRFPDADRAGIEIKNASSLEHSGELLNHSTDESDFENRIIREIVFRLATGENKQKITSWLIDQKYEIPSYAEELYAKGLKEFKEQKKQYQEQQKVVSSKFDVIPGGVGQDLKPEDVDPKELSMGIKVEMEHTEGTDELSKEEKEAIAEDIAFDHLSEDPAYYTKLKKMEKSSGDWYQTIQKWVALGFTEDEAREWRKVDYTDPEWMLELKNRGITPEQAKPWFSSHVIFDWDIRPDRLRFLIDMGFTPKDVKEQFDSGWDVEKFINLHKNKVGTKLKKMEETKDLSYIKEGARRYFNKGDMVSGNLFDTGVVIDSGSAKQMVDAGYDVSGAVQTSFDRNIKPNERCVVVELYDGSLGVFLASEVWLNDNERDAAQIELDSGDRVTVNMPGNKYDGQVATVLYAGQAGATQRVIKFDSGETATYLVGFLTRIKKNSGFGGNTGADADNTQEDVELLRMYESDAAESLGELEEETDRTKRKQLKKDLEFYKRQIEALETKIKNASVPVQEDTVDSFTQLIAEALVSDMTEAQEYLASIFDAPWQKVKRQLTAELNGVYSDYIEKGLEQHQKALDGLSVKREYAKKIANQLSDYLDTYPMFETTNKDAMRDFVLDAMDTFKMDEFELILALDEEYIYGNLDKEFVEAAQAVLDTMPVAASVKTSSLLYPYAWKSFADSDDPKEVAQYNEIANVLSLQVDKAVAVVEQFGLPVDRVNFDKIISNQLTPVDLLLIIECYNMSEENAPMFVLSYYSVPKGESDRTKWQAKVSNAVGFANLKEVIAAAIHFAENVVKQGIKKRADDVAPAAVLEYNQSHATYASLQIVMNELQSTIVDLHQRLDDITLSVHDKSKLTQLLELKTVAYEDARHKAHILANRINELNEQIDWAQVKGTKKHADDEEEFIDADGHVLNEGDFVMLRDGARHGVIVSLNLYGKYIPQTELTPAEYPEQEVIIEWQDGSKGYYTPDELLVVRA